MHAWKVYISKYYVSHLEKKIWQLYRDQLLARAMRIHVCYIAIHAQHAPFSVLGLFVLRIVSMHAFTHCVMSIHLAGSE